MTAIPFAEWRPDVAALNSSFTGDVLNVLCSGAGYIPFPQLAVFSGALKLKDTTGSFLTQTYKMAGVTATEADALSLSRSSTATYFDADGVLQSAASDVLRIDHDPVSGDALGALIEDDAENLLIYSEEFDQSSAWTVFGSSISADQAAAPDGNTTADKLTESTDNSVHDFFGGATIAANTDYVCSLFVKAAGRTKGALQYAAAGELTGLNCIFDLTAKTFTTSTFGTATLADAGLDDVGGGWFRAWVAGNVDATSTRGAPFVVLADDDGNTTYTGDGTSGLYVWGAQLEVGTKPTSYIKTTTAAATRSADTLTLNATGKYDWSLTLGDDTVKTFSAHTDDLAVSASDLTSKYIQSYQAVNVDVNVPSGGFTATDEDGTKYIFAGSPGKLFLLDNTDLGWKDVSQASTTYGSTDTERWRFAQYGQYVVAVNANDNPQVYQLGVDSAFSDLGGSPPKARFVSVCGDFLFLSGLTDHPNRVQWSALNDITGWTAGTDSSDFQDFAYGEMVMGVTPATNPIIIHKHAITFGTFVPGSDVVFTFQKVMDQRGAAAPYSICTRGTRTFFADAGGFYMIGSDGSEVPIGKEKVDRTVFTTIDGATLYDIIGEIDPFYSRVYFAVRYVSTTTAFDRLIIYDWDLQRWTQVGGDLSILFPLASGTIGYTLDNLTDLTGYSLDDLPFSLDSQVWQGGAPVMAAFNTDDKLCFFAGSPTEATITTQETGNTDGTLSYVNGASIIADTNDVHLSVGTRMRRGDSVSFGAEYSATPASDRLDFRSCSRFHTFKTRIPADATWTHAQGIDVAAKKAGRR